MYIMDSHSMYGVAKGLYLCNLKRASELNDRLAQRNVPSAPLQPYLNTRPVSTKYSLLPILDQRQQASVPLEKLPAYNPSQVFYPGGAQAPWSGFANAIDDESKLHNQFFAMQKCEQSQFVPSSSSDLYRSTIPQPLDGGDNPFPYLNKQHMLATKPYEGTSGHNLFQNHTRQQRMNDTNVRTNLK